VDTPRLIRLPAIEFDKELADVAAAIALVAGGGARRVTLSGLRRSEEIAADALALAQAAGVEFALQRARRDGPPAIVVGPVEE
jgi:hypothetical protein